MIRESIVAGQFYPSRASDLDSFFSSIIINSEEAEEAIAIIAPHAGYPYSGKIAAKAYTSVVVPDNIVILGPNHTGRGTTISVFEKGAWITPYGQVKINEEFTASLIEKASPAKSDINAHLYEHSIEVQLPFLQYTCKDKNNLKIIPVAISEHRPENLKEFALALAETIKETQEKTLIVASTDFSHYVPADSAKEKDNICFKAIEELDEDKLWDEVHNRDISMCGLPPVYVTLLTAKALGASKGTLIAYGTSGDVTGNNTEVVGYGALSIK